MFTDLVTLADLSSDDILRLLGEAAALKQANKAGQNAPLLAGQSLAMIFEKPSLRTRFTFEIGMFQLGGHAVVVHMEGARLGERESVPDVAHNLERWVDGIMARTFSHEAVADLATHAAIPVINGLTDRCHPCQILADVQALSEHKGSDFSSLKLAYVGDGNNVCASWLHFAARVPLNVSIVSPPGYEADAEVLAMAQRDGTGIIEQTPDLESGLRDADAVYTDVWASMGQEEQKDERKKVFMPYQVNRQVMSMAKPDAVFMHCLPAKRGLEVTDEVIDSPASIVFDQAENRLHAQKAVLVTLMRRDAQRHTPKSRHRAGAAFQA